MEYWVLAVDITLVLCHTNDIFLIDGNYTSILVLLKIYSTIFCDVKCVCTSHCYSSYSIISWQISSMPKFFTPWSQYDGSQYKLKRNECNYIYTMLWRYMHNVRIITDYSSPPLCHIMCYLFWRMTIILRILRGMFYP